MRAVKRSLKQLGDPDTSQSEADQLLHTRECLLNIGRHIDDILTSFTDHDKAKDWRGYVFVFSVVMFLKIFKVFPYEVSQSACTASATGHHLRTFQTIVESVHVWLVVPRRPVSER